MEVREDVVPADKIYCCSNYPQTEASLIAKFNLFMGVISLLLSLITLIIVPIIVASRSSTALELVAATPLPTSSSPANEQANIVTTTPTTTTTTTTTTTPAPIPSPNQNVSNVTLVFDMSSETVLWMSSVNIVWSVIGLALSLLLYCGVKKRNHGYLLTWFIIVLISVLISVLYGVLVLIFVQTRLTFIVLLVVSFLYNWYSLWIVKLLMSEIRGVREGYRNPLDDEDMENTNTLVPSSDSFTVTVDKF